MFNKNNSKGDIQELNMGKMGTERKPRSVSKKVNVELSNHKIPEYYSFRKSERNLKKKFVNQTLKDLENKILSFCEDGLEVKYHLIHHAMKNLCS